MSYLFKLPINSKFTAVILYNRNLLFLEKTRESPVDLIV